MHTLFYTPNRIICDGNLTSQKYIDYIKRSDSVPYAMAITHERYKLIWPLSDRDFVFVTSMTHDLVNKRYLVLRKTCVHPKVPVVKGVVRASTFAGWVFEELSPIKCRVQQIVYVNQPKIFLN